MRQILLFCDGGLGNRLNSLIGGLLVSDMIGANPIICWPKNNWCGCAFEDLFDTDILVVESGVNDVFKDNQKSIFLIHENQTNIPIPLSYNHSLHSIEQIKNKDESVVYYHNSIPEYFTNDQVILKLQNFKIKDTVLEEVHKFIKINKIDESVQGILFRKTDYEYNSSISLNTDAVYNQIKINTDTRYYVCSDDMQVEKAFSKLDNVHIYNKTSYVEKYKEGSWNESITDDQGRVSTFNVNRSRQSVIEAFIGLLIMSKTTIVVDFPSTFLHFAKHYSKINF